MLYGLADDVVYGPPDPAVVDTVSTIANMFGASLPAPAPFTQSTDQSTITVYPVTEVKKAVPRAPGPGAGVLDKVLPKKLGANGKVTIWGLPPAVAYAIAAVILAGGGMLAYQHFAGGGRRVARNPKRRRNPRRGGRRSSRYKR